jgi:hypothetical protein
MIFVRGIMSLVISLILVHTPFVHASNGIEIETTEELDRSDPEGCRGFERKDNQCIKKGLRYNCALTKCVNDKDHTSFTNEYRQCHVKYSDEKQVSLCQNNLNNFAKTVAAKQAHLQLVKGEELDTDSTYSSELMILGSLIMWKGAALAGGTGALCKAGGSSGSGWGNYLMWYGIIAGLNVYMTQKSKRDAEKAFGDAMARMKKAINDDQIGWKNGGQKGFLTAMRDALQSAKSAAEDKKKTHQKAATIYYILSTIAIVAASVESLQPYLLASANCNYALGGMAALSGYLEDEAASDTSDVIGKLSSALSDMDLLIKKFEEIGGDGDSSVAGAGLSQKSIITAGNGAGGTSRSNKVSVNGSMAKTNMMILIDDDSDEATEEKTTFAPKKDCDGGNTSLCRSFATTTPVNVSKVIDAKGKNSKALTKISEQFKSEGINNVDGASLAARNLAKKANNKIIKQALEDKKNKIAQGDRNILKAALNSDKKKAKSYLQRQALRGASPLRLAVAANNAPLSNIGSELEDVQGNKGENSFLASLGKQGFKMPDMKGMDIDFGGDSVNFGKPKKEEKLGELESEHVRDDIGLNKDKSISIWRQLSMRYKIIYLRKTFERE